MMKERAARHFSRALDHFRSQSFSMSRREIGLAGSNATPYQALMPAEQSLKP
jgi:hypothetical protein